MQAYSWPPGGFQFSVFSSFRRPDTQLIPPRAPCRPGALREVEAYTGQPAQRMRRLSPVPRSALSVFCFSWWAVRVQVLLFLRCCVDFLLWWSFRVWRLAFVVVPFLSAVVDFRRFRCFDSSTFLTFGCPPSFTFHPLFVAASLPRFWVFLGVLRFSWFFCPSGRFLSLYVSSPLSLTIGPPPSWHLRGPVAASGSVRSGSAAGAPAPL